MYGAAHSDFLWRSCSMLRTSVPSPRHRVRDFPCLVPSAGSYPVRPTLQGNAMPSARDSVQNALLASLPSVDRKRVLLHLKRVSLSFGDILYQPDQAIRRVYFPVTALISLLATVDGGPALEVGMIGREGMLGVPLVFGVKQSPVRALVQGAGLALVMPTAVFLRVLRRSLPLRGKLYGCAQE